MALYKSNIAIPLTGGIDTKTAEKIVKNGFFLALKNIVRVKSGELRKRFGFTALSKNVLGSGNPITTGKRLASFRDDLLLLTDDRLYTYGSANDAWAERGKLVNVLVDSTPVIRNSAKQCMGDSAYGSGYTVSAWEDSRTDKGVACSVVNDDTGASLIADAVVSATGSRPKVVFIRNTFVITYYDGGVLKCRRISLTDPTVLLSEQTLQSDITDNPYDLTAYNSNVAVCAYNTASEIKLMYVTPEGETGSVATNTYPDPVTLTTVGTNALTVVADNERAKIYFLYHDDAGTDADDVRVSVINPDLDASSIQSVTVESVAAVRNITAAIYEDGSLISFYEVEGASSYTHVVRTNTIDTDLTVGSPLVFKRSVGLASKAFTVDDVAYVTTVHESDLQSTYFTIRDDEFIVTRMQAGVSGGLTRGIDGSLKSGLTRVNVNAQGGRTFLVQVKSRLTTETASELSAFVGYNQQTLSFNETPYDTDTLGGNFHVAGGIVLAYDGAQVVEHGFHVFPENATLAQSDTADGALTATGTYRVKVVYEWVDGQGQIHRSAPLVSTDDSTVTLTGSNDTITVTCPTLRLTEKSDVKIVVYRTKNGETTVYYRDNDADNDATLDTVDIVLTQSDTSLATKEILYTVGGTLENIAPPACKVVHKHKNRIFLGGLEDGDTLQYSREHVYGEGASFSDGLTKRVDPRGGPLTALSSLDDKLVIFKRNALFIMFGDGPADSGAQDNFTLPEPLSSDVGCDNQKSIAITPLGVMFQSTKGIYLLDRGLSLQYVGAPVEDYNDLTITSAVVIDNTNEVRFTTETGECLVYNYLFNQWSTFDNYAAVSATNALNTYIHLKSDGIANKEVEDQYLDAGQRIKMSIETNWFQFADVQGFQRIYRWALLGDFKSHHYTRVKLAYDWEPVYNETIYFDTQQSLGTSTFGDGVFGDTVFGGQGSQVFQFRSKPRRQKCQSIKLLIEDIDTVTENGGASFNLVCITFETGRKVGIAKMGNRKTRGS